jgi:Cd2+/Zn2+-exporting ATPase
LVISIPLSFFGGIGGASRRGILIKGGNYLDALNKLDTVVFDKTGTLTKGVFDVQEIIPAESFSKEQLLETAVKAEAFSNHPIALSILKAYGKETARDGLSDYSETAGKGVSVTVGGQRILAGSAKLMEQEGIAFVEPRKNGTMVHVAADGAYMGCIIISDEIRPDSRAAVASLKSAGIRRAVMLTGDNPQTAAAVAEELQLDEVHAGLLPQQKVEQLTRLSREKRPGGTLCFVGDGINDAPVLAIADVGVAMGGLGSDAAIEAADVVLMTDEPSKLSEAVAIARRTKRIVWQNIIFALGAKALFMLLGTLGMASMWEAVFADVGVALLAILNAMRVIRKQSPTSAR